MCFFIKLGIHVSHSERMNPIDVGGQRSKVKVTIEMYGNKLVNTIETKWLCASSSNLADMLTMVNSIDFGGHMSDVKATMGFIYKCGVRGDATLCVFIFIFGSIPKSNFLKSFWTLLFWCILMQFLYFYAVKSFICINFFCNFHVYKWERFKCSKNFNEFLYIY